MVCLELGRLSSLHLAAAGLVDERLVDVGNDSTTGNGSLDEGVEFFVTTNGELQVTGRDTLDLEILAGVSGELEDFSREVLEDGTGVHSGRSSDTVTVVDGLFQETVHTTVEECFSEWGL